MFGNNLSLVPFGRVAPADLQQELRCYACYQTLEEIRQSGFNKTLVSSICCSNIICSSCIESAPHPQRSITPELEIKNRICLICHRLLDQRTCLLIERLWDCIEVLSTTHRKSVPVQRLLSGLLLSQQQFMKQVVIPAFPKEKVSWDRDSRTSFLPLSFEQLFSSLDRQLAEIPKLSAADSRAISATSIEPLAMSLLDNLIKLQHCYRLPSTTLVNRKNISDCIESISKKLSFASMIANPSNNFVLNLSFPKVKQRGDFRDSDEVTTFLHLQGAQKQVQYLLQSAATLAAQQVAKQDPSLYLLQIRTDRNAPKALQQYVSLEEKMITLVRSLILTSLPEGGIPAVATFIKEIQACEMDVTGKIKDPASPELTLEIACTLLAMVIVFFILVILSYGTIFLTIIGALLVAVVMCMCVVVP